MNAHDPHAQRSGSRSPSLGLPETPVGRWVRPLSRFLQIEFASGALLVACAAIALALANSRWAEAYHEFWQTRIGFSIGGFELYKPLELWINEALMTIFFFVVGLEIKREMLAGELREMRKAALPVLAALGGMVAPAAIYLALERGRPGEPGWGIPVATDIAFVVGLLALLGPRVPLGLKIFLLSLAIADDIGAILVIALFYAGDIHATALALAALGIGLTYVFNRIGVRQVPIYVVLGAGVWLAFFKSGIHPTVSGVLLGLLTPAHAWVGDGTLRDMLDNVIDRLQGDWDDEDGSRQQTLSRLVTTARERVSPLERLEIALHPWSAFVIMPLFALANAGVAVDLANVHSSTALAVVVGLVVGKPLGILLFSWMAVRAGVAVLPSGVDWRSMTGAGCLAGIGFTMSLFIAGLALKSELLAEAKTGILVGSLTSALAGWLLLFMWLPRKPDSARREAPALAGNRGL